MDPESRSGSLPVSNASVLGVVVLSLILLVFGAVVAGFVGLPALEDVDGEFSAVNDSHTELRGQVTVDNPNPVGTPELEAVYTVTMNDLEIAEERDTVAVSPGRTTERTTLSMANDRIPDWWISHVENDERTEVAVDARVTGSPFGQFVAASDRRTVETDLLSGFNSTERRVVDVDAPVVGEQELYVAETRAMWDETDEDHTEIDYHATVENPTPIDAPISRVGYTVTMNDVVVGEGDLEDEQYLEAETATEIDLTATIDHDRLPVWWVTHVENDEVTEFRVEFEADVALPTGTVTVSLEELEHAETVETDVWGEKREKAVS